MGRLHALDHRTIVVAVGGSTAAVDGVALAAELVSQKGELVFVHVVEVPLELPLDARPDPDEAPRRQAARELTARCAALADRYGVSSRKVVERAHAAGPAIVAAAERYRADLVVVGGERRLSPSGRVRLGSTATHVLKHARCRVMLVSAGVGELATAANVARAGR